MIDVTMSGCKVCVVNPRTSKFGEYCRAECRNVGEAYARGEQNERNRIADALERDSMHWGLDSPSLLIGWIERLRKGEV